ncbi:hypothetical protein SUGI_0244680 [Cryptomeria japonica]|nr:hypothetical protein SUGI_0244680 [Cryptomeria japonica]
MEIIPGLPEDLGMQCFVRVPYRYHCNLRAVCKSWDALLSCQHFYQQRQRHGQCEEGVVSLYYFGQNGGSIIVACSLDRQNSWLWWGFSTAAATKMVC